MPMVTVIIPTYNKAKYIGSAIDSVLKQSYTDFELIIVDDGSTDDTKKITSSFNDNRILYTYQNNSGPSAAKNKGLTLAKGGYIAFLDSDDIWDEHKLSYQVALLEQDRDIGLVFCNILFIDTDSNVIKQRKYSEEHVKDALRKILLGCFIITPSSVIIRKECFNKLGYFDEDLWYSDWELYVRIIKNYKIGHIDKFLINYRISPTGLDHNVHKANLFRIKTLNKIWSDKILSKKYNKIKKIVYSRTCFHLGIRNFEINNWGQARLYFIRSLMIDLVNLKAFLYLFKSLLGNRLYKYLKQNKRKAGNYIDSSIYKSHLTVLHLIQYLDNRPFLSILSRLLKYIIKLTVKIQTRFNKLKFPSRVTGGWRWIWFWRWSIINGWYEYNTVQICKKFIRPDMRVMDIGAHIGYFSSLFSDLVGRDGKILAIEPCPENYPLLVHNLKQKKHRVVEFFNLAFSDTTQTTKLYLSSGNSMHSLIKECAGDKNGSVDVKTTTLDDFLHNTGNYKIDFIKIDVEGAELKVLSGMKKTLQKNPNLILLIELFPKIQNASGVTQEDFIQELRNMGFEPKEITDNAQLTQPDVLSEETRNLVCFRKKNETSLLQIQE